MVEIELYILCLQQNQNLSKLKCQLPVTKRCHVIYKVNCSECKEFYIGLTNRRLETRLHEHFTNDNSALYRHSFLTDHVINYSNRLHPSKTLPN